MVLGGLLGKWVVMSWVVSKVMLEGERIWEIVMVGAWMGIGMVEEK